MNINGKKTQEVNIQEVYEMLSGQHRNVFLYKVEEIIFICRSLGRIEFKDLIADDRWTDYDKEEIVCEACTLYPENFDFGNCDAGIPTNLAKEIIKRSGLENIETRKRIMDYYRGEMSDIDHQVTCMINEAFPAHDIEEIEKWDIEKTSKYLSRAEWILANMRGMDIHFDPFDTEEEITEEITEEISEETSETNFKGEKKEKMTPEKLAELEKQFPTIKWREDEVDTKGIDALKGGADSTAPALRTGL